VDWEGSISSIGRRNDRIRIVTARDAADSEADEYDRHNR
jgi:hypothetical protein